MHFTCASSWQLLIDHFRTNTRKFCHTVIGTLHKQTDSTLHLLNILDILTVNNLYQHNALKFLHLWQKGLLKWIYSKIIFNMQAVFMDTTPDMLPKNLCKPWVYNNSGEQAFAKKIKNDLDKTIENLDKGTSKSSLKVPLWNQKCQRPPKQKWKSFSQKQKKTKPAFLSILACMLTNTYCPVTKSQSKLSSYLASLLFFELFLSVLSILYFKFVMYNSV